MTTGKPDDNLKVATESPCSSDSYDLGEQDDSVLSPCTFQCKLVTIDDLELCASCGRTRSEIVNWTKQTI